METSSDFPAHKHVVDLDPPWFADATDNYCARGMCNENVEAQYFMGIPHKYCPLVLVDETKIFGDNPGVAHEADPLRQATF